MIIQNPNEYTHIGFAKSSTKNKKYDAILKHKITGQLRKVPFGQLGYEQYKDTTGLNLYSNLDHLDKERRKRYKSRHEGEQKNKFSSGYWSWKYLW